MPFDPDPLPPPAPDSFPTVSGTPAEKAISLQSLFPEFNPVFSLKAIAYHGEPELAAMPPEIRQFLIEESSRVESVTAVKMQALTIGVSPQYRDTRSLNL